MYISTWKTPLFMCDSESCILSFILPCHIYSKINYPYAFSFLAYGGCIISIRFMYYWIMTLYTNACPAHHSDYCLGLGNQCESYYTIVDGTTTPCIYRKDIDACTYNFESCIKVDDGLYIWISIGCFIMYLFLFLMNYQTRKIIQYQHSIKGSSDICESTLLSPCGLAQAYREIV